METGSDEAGEVLVVGGGIVGASLAYSLASAGLAVSVLEATTEFSDRVRGESMHAWGVREAQLLGLESVLLDAGARIAPTWHQYGSGSLVAELPMHAMVPGVAGTLNLRHPLACQALLVAAAGAGARVRRGVEHVEVSSGRPMAVRYEWQGRTVEEVTPLVVGADGRASTVRRSIGAAGPCATYPGDRPDAIDDHGVSVGNAWEFIHRACLHEGTCTESGVAPMDMPADRFRQGGFDRDTRGRRLGR